MLERFHSKIFCSHDAQVISETAEILHDVVERIGFVELSPLPMGASNHTFIYPRGSDRLNMTAYDNVTTEVLAFMRYE